MADPTAFNPEDFGSNEFNPAGFAAFIETGYVIRTFQEVIIQGIGAAVPAPVKLLHAAAVGRLAYGTAKVTVGSDTDQPAALSLWPLLPELVWLFAQRRL